ncbi:MAG: hypothetical protein HY913_01300 [Desulfomonile tiedjei]|nr:hypothetical protein [Desulfomonile tiedjei]
MPVTVAKEIFRAITRVRDNGRCNMMDWRCVYSVLSELGEDEAADWLESNVGAYIRGLSQGFAVSEGYKGLLH